jgi:ribosomal protein L22
MADETPKDEVEEKVEAAEAAEAVADDVTAEETTDETAAAAEESAEKAAAEAEEAEAEAAADEAPAETAEEPVAEAEAPAEEAAAEAPAKPKRTRSRAKKTEEPAKPAAKAKPARKRGEAPVDAPVVRATAKYVRTSARKARLVCDHIRGKSVPEARAILAHTPRAVAEDWSKLLESAVANAEHNHELLGDDLRILTVTADEGPTLKRFRPRAMGRASRIRKRTSHLSIALTPKEQ